MLGLNGTFVYFLGFSQTQARVPVVRLLESSTTGLRVAP